MKLWIDNLWVDDLRAAPDGYEWARSVEEAKTFIAKFIDLKENALDEWDFPPTDIWTATVLIDLDHDMGAMPGGDCINLLNWLEQKQAEGLDINYYMEFRLHTMNPIGRDNMKRIIERNGWRLRV